MVKKIIATGEQARKKIIEGALFVADAVGRTLGPAGKNALIYKNYKSPPITNDGVTVARHIVLDDEVQDLGAQALVEACMKTNQMAGDGTTTTAVLAGAIIQTVEEKLKGQKQMLVDVPAVNVIALSREIAEQGKVVMEKIKERTAPADESALLNVTTTSMRNSELGKMVAEMVQKVGAKGYISIEDNWLTKNEISSELIVGMKKMGTYATPYFCTRPREAIWENTQVLVCNEAISSVNNFQKLVRELSEGKDKNLVIINGCENEPFDKSFILATLNTIAQRNKGVTAMPNVLLVKAPALTSEELEDVAAFCNARFINRHQGMKLEEVSTKKVPSDLGFTQKIVVNEDEFIITGGAGLVEARIKELTKLAEQEKDTMFKEKMLRRIAGLSSGVGIIRVGANTEQERTYLKDKLEDAKNAAKAALEEGVVRGGGLCLQQIADELGESNILYTALKAPYERIQKNAGGVVEIPESILDSAKVTRIAVQSACSIASQLITAEIAIAERRVGLWDKFEKTVNKMFPDANMDYRADENQDPNLQ